MRYIFRWNTYSRKELNKGECVGPMDKKEFPLDLKKLSLTGTHVDGDLCG